MHLNALKRFFIYSGLMLNKSSKFLNTIELHTLDKIMKTHTKYEPGFNNYNTLYLFVIIIYSTVYVTHMDAPAIFLSNIIFRFFNFVLIFAANVKHTHYITIYILLYRHKRNFQIFIRMAITCIII